jgi:hypothetical protein
MVDPLANAKALRACVKLARTLDPNGDGPRADVYWHTREAVFELCLDPAVRGAMPRVDVFSRVASREDPFSFPWTEKALRQEAARYWPAVAHPELIVREVLES